MPNIPRFHAPGMVDREGRLSKVLVDFLESLTSEQKALLTSVTAVTNTVNTTASGEDLLDSMYGTNGVQVLGSIPNGVEIRGPDLSAIQSRMGPPGINGEDGQDAWPIPGPKGDKGEPGVTRIAYEDAETPEPWPLLPAVNAYAEFTARSLLIGVKTIPSGYGLYVIGPYEVAAGAMVEVEAGAVLEIG